MEKFNYEEIEKYYDADYFDTPEKKSVYVNTSTVINSEWHRQACAWFDSVVPVEGKKLLDAGCGVGHFMTGFQNLGAETYGCDVSNFCAEIMEKKFPGRFYHTRVEEMTGVPKNFFNIIYCGDVLEHVPANLAKPVLLKLIQAAKPGGFLYIAIDTTSYIHEGPQDDSHINMQGWELWLKNFLTLSHLWDFMSPLTEQLRESKAFPGFPYSYWRFAVLQKKQKAEKEV